MHIEKNTILHSENTKSILLDVAYSKETAAQPVVVFCHGYKGFKDWGAWNMMGQQIANAGFCFIKFNFSHNGGSIDNPIDFPDLDAFGNNNYSKELEDLESVLNWVELQFQHNKNINTDKIYVIGHSRGGGISIIKTAEDTRIKKLITLASVCDFEKRTATTSDLRSWKTDGVKYVTNSRTKQQMPHYYQFYEDFIANKARLNIENATKKIRVPFLIMHGNKDTSVSLEEAEEIHKWNAASKLHIVENANHVFNISHPWEKTKPSPEFQNTIDAIIKFIS